MKSEELKALLPDEKNMENIWNLLQLNPYSPLEESDDLYIKALKEVMRYHRTHNPFYKDYLDYYQFDIEKINSVSDLKDVPFIHANFFKTNVISTVKPSEAVLHVTSSGTTGQKSQHFLDSWTNEIIFYISDLSQVENDFVSNEKCNYLIFNFEPFTGFKTGTATTNQKMMNYAPAEQINYALRYNGHQGHDFDSFGVVDKLIEYQKEGLPVRMLGFAAFLNFAIDQLKDFGYDELPLHPDSHCLFGGGWKNHKDKELPKDIFYDKIVDFFKIPLQNIRDKYGSVEHPITYVECDQHHLHIPTYERVVVRDVKTLEPVEYGKPGFAHLISPVITSMPSHSILMGDLIILHEPNSCKCGKATPWIEIAGRAGTSKNKSCAIAASEMLKR